MNHKVLGLRTTIYKVQDVKAATEWYTKAFEIAPYFNEAFYVGFEIGGYELGLQPSEQTPGEKTDAVVAYWGVEDVDAEFKRFVNLGAVEHEAPQEVGGGIWVATIKDPWENVIGLIYNPHFKLKA
jgi:lactoylglutathione lyase